MSTYIFGMHGSFQFAVNYDLNPLIAAQCILSTTVG